MEINWNVKIDNVIHIHLHESQTISEKDQKLLNDILARFSALVRRLQRVDALNPNH